MKLVVMEHQFMYDRYQIAKVVKQTKAMSEVIYWRSGKWEDHTSRRKSSSIIREIGIAENVSDNELSKMADRLVSAHAEMDRRIKDARAAYISTVQGLAI